MEVVIKKRGNQDDWDFGREPGSFICVNGK